MNNDFSPKTRELFIFKYDCIECSGNQSHELHHIMGRGHKNSDLESSPLNAGFLCHDCHDGNHNKKPLDKSKLLILTIKYLLSINYQLTEKDLLFYKKYEKYYKI